MSKRLQVLFGDAEYRRLQRDARKRGMTVSDWVREAIKAASRGDPTGSVERKLASVRASAGHAFPAPDIDVMLEEIERGYRGGAPG